MRHSSPFVSYGLIDELLRDVSPGYFIKPLHGDALPTQIKVDVKENANEFIVHAEIPGASKENIDVAIDGNTVNIRAQISQVDTESENDKVLRSERYYGAVSRSFQLPVNIDESTSKASYENGVLRLSLVKKQQKNRSRLTVD